MKPFALAASLAALSLTASAAPAGATVTVGQIATPTNSCGSPVDRVQPTVTQGNSYVMPANGTITSWSTNTGGNGGQLKMKVFRLVAGTTGTYMVVGHDGPRDLTLNAINTFPASIQVKAGDVLGLNSFSGAPDCGTLVPGDSYLREPGDLADGGSVAFTGVVMDRHLDISAVLDPTNSVTFGGVSRNKKKGTATLTVNVPNPGSLAVGGNGVKPATVTATAAGAVKLPIKATGKKRKKLNATGKVKLTPSLTFTPTGGVASTQSASVKLKKKL